MSKNANIVQKENRLMDLGLLCKNIDPYKVTASKICNLSKHAGILTKEKCRIVFAKAIKVNYTASLLVFHLFTTFKLKIC